MSKSGAAPQTLYEKIWNAHVVEELGDGKVLLYIDRHLVNEVTSPQAFENLRQAGRSVRRPEATIAVADHNVPTTNRLPGTSWISDPDSRLQVETLEENVKTFAVPYIPLISAEQGIVHIIGPELGLTQPGMTIVCGDSHTSTHGAFGALAFGIGTSEAELVLATQTLVQRKSRTMLIRINGNLPANTSAKDLILFIIGKIGANGATGHVIEYSGDTIRSFGMAERMTVCNMSIEAGARAGLVAPDEKTVKWLRRRKYAPHPSIFDAAAEAWLSLCTDPGASFDKTIDIEARDVAPMVTWGTSPDAVLPIDGCVPDPAKLVGADKRAQAERALRYMGLSAGTKLEGLPIDVAFIGSCTNGRIEDLRAAAQVIAGKKLAPNVKALVVPGSGRVKARAESEGLDRIFVEAGFQWREPGCSMCLGMNPDKLQPGERCASSSNRNFEGRQGSGGRTHLMSPAMVAAAALHGHLVDVRNI